MILHRKIYINIRLESFFSFVDLDTGSIYIYIYIVSSVLAFTSINPWVASSSSRRRSTSFPSSAFRYDRFSYDLPGATQIDRSSFQTLPLFFIPVHSLKINKRFDTRYRECNTAKTVIELLELLEQKISYRRPWGLFFRSHSEKSSWRIAKLAIARVCFPARSLQLNTRLMNESWPALRTQEFCRMRNYRPSLQVATCAS